jgi:hypothetical protein
MEAIDTMEAAVEPTSTDPGNAMTESEPESGNPVDTSASSEVEEDQAFQSEGAHRIYVPYVSYRINTS